MVTVTVVMVEAAVVMVTVVMVEAAVVMVTVVMVEAAVVMVTVVMVEAAVVAEGRRLRVKKLKREMARGGVPWLPTGEGVVHWARPAPLVLEFPSWPTAT